MKDRKIIITKISKGESLSHQEMENIYNVFKSGSPQGKKERSDFLNEVSKHTSVDGFHQFVDQMFTHYTRKGGPFDSKKDTLKGEPNIFRTAGAETFNKDLIVHEAKINGFKATVSMDNGNFDATVSEIPPRVLAHFARFQDFVKANKDGPESVAETFTRNLSFVVCNNVLMEEAEKAGLLTHISKSSNFQGATWLDAQKETIVEDIRKAAQEFNSLGVKSGATASEKQAEKPTSKVEMFQKKSSLTDYIKFAAQMITTIAAHPNSMKLSIALVKSLFGSGPNPLDEIYTKPMKQNSLGELNQPTAQEKDGQSQALKQEQPKPSLETIDSKEAVKDSPNSNKGKMTAAILAEHNKTKSSSRGI
ncbi:MAG: Dot/Icm T4SS effector [Candidatus Midichloria mitochondrii]|uniref:Uncharacterized protein n=1 Tax=Midichloria mitochondrii (strain IricVA) TaxID=696127 RepID=F7XU70_MIDMI|nr:hypothetical protein [Candidatus Midichloria mitochondrii]AEI89429.1 hypothetical protein midi_01153 [Candidatus Midichloria mitochondrii IricVA]MDJ1256461.1 hypothetical protein [Candidatus Midichloria mitochondrii]MDJ1288165.1 hypothetical protein [Candidatus Midichloria mitochondrii]MDJ1299049.1 hypothetical protein [Candidatus Midichloria mitochondrii]MDJ1313219.1 hypothetical protein [Candidatus Midichloria mitochondrii]